MREREPVAISVVIPVYRGEITLRSLAERLAPLTSVCRSPSGREFQITQVFLVWDHGPDDSPTVMRQLAADYPFIDCIWLTRNFGQHAATLAGITSSYGRWIVTMDEDGLHAPEEIPLLLDKAFESRATLVYGVPANPAPHAWWRNASSRLAKGLFSRLSPGIPFESFSSFRLIEGDVARSAAAYTGPGAYLDVSLNWVTNAPAVVPVTLHAEGRPAQSYSFGRLLGHFGRLALASGTRPLLWVSALGFVFFLLGIVVAAWVLINLAIGATTPTGWASTFTALLVIGGLTLLSLGVIAQFLRASTEAALGRPLYVTGSDPAGVFSDE
jgi:glycosyltransferase involved in cell wall biosynthesis